jgi:molybdopterin-guanine dinucleotide biosynthesis protein A
MATTAGVVLCGGASRRMGRPKAELPFGDEALLQRVVRILGGELDLVIVVAGPDQVVPTGLTVVRDAERFAGPLAGLGQGLGALRGVDVVFATGCDCPFLTADVVQTLVGSCPLGGAAAAEIGGELQPLPAAYCASLAGAISASLRAGERSLRSLLGRIAVVRLSEARMRAVDPDLAAFAPLNTPEEYAAALDRLARGV